MKVGDPSVCIKCEGAGDVPDAFGRCPPVTVVIVSPGDDPDAIIDYQTSLVKPPLVCDRPLVRSEDGTECILSDHDCIYDYEYVDNNGKCRDCEKTLDPYCEEVTLDGVLTDCQEDQIMHSSRRYCYVEPMNCDDITDEHSEEMLIEYYYLTDWYDNLSEQ